MANAVFAEALVYTGHDYLFCSAKCLAKFQATPDASRWNRFGPGTCCACVREKSALDLLKERYARGGIEREEFEQKKRDLESRRRFDYHVVSMGGMP